MSPALRKEHVQNRIREIRANVERIRRYASLPDEAFFADERNLYTVQHLLLMCVEAAASICTHIMARLAHAAPSTYAECFMALSDQGVIVRDLAQRLVRAVRFRNLLVHQYWNVDSQQVLKIAREHVDDFTAFVRQIGRWLEESATRKYGVDI